MVLAALATIGIGILVMIVVVLPILVHIVFFFILTIVIIMLIILTAIIRAAAQLSDHLLQSVLPVLPQHVEVARAPLRRPPDALRELDNGSVAQGGRGRGGGER